jgi:hypothetical protein
VSLRRLAALLLALGALAACGEEAAGEGTAHLWITRDRGSEVVLTATVPAGISAMEALRRKADVETRYGGRFVQSIDGIEGSLADQHDWFFYVNGYEADRGATDYQLHDGDVLWFDHRPWGEEPRVPIVVGAFPEPFMHGWDGKRRKAVVIARPNDPLARRLAARLRARVGRGKEGDNVVLLVDGTQMRGSVSGGPGEAVSFAIGRKTAERLLEDPSFVRYRYELP